MVDRSFGFIYVTVLRELRKIPIGDKPWVSSLGGPSVTLPRRVERNDRTTIVETCRFALSPHGLRPCVASAATDSHFHRLCLRLRSRLNRAEHHDGFGDSVTIRMFGGRF